MPADAEPDQRVVQDLRNPFRQFQFGDALVEAKPGAFGAL